MATKTTKRRGTRKPAKRTRTARVKRKATKRSTAKRPAAKRPVAKRRTPSKANGKPKANGTPEKDRTGRYIHVRLRPATHRRLCQHGNYGDSLDTILAKVLDKIDATPNGTT